jgi:chromosome segregation ATPase
MIRGLFRFVFRAAVIVGIVGVGAALFFGSHRVRGMAHELKGEVHSFFHQDPNDPRVLRGELESLQREYPKRLSQVRSDRANLEAQMRELAEQRAIAARVVELANEDLAQLDERLSESTAAREVGGAVLARSASAEVLAARSERIRRTRDSYVARQEEAGFALTQLEEQAEQLQQLEARLESEHVDLTTQVDQLDRQIDAIERNERLLEIVRERHQSMQELEENGAKTVEQIRTRLESVLRQQRAELEQVIGDASTSYLGRARLELKAGNASCALIGIGR